MNQCWGKLLLKVMRYNIELLPTKSNCVSYFLMDYFCITFSHLGWACLLLFVFK